MLARRLDMDAPEESSPAPQPGAVTPADVAVVGRWTYAIGVVLITAAIVSVVLFAGFVIVALGADDY